MATDLKEESKWTLAFQGAESRIKFGIYNGREAVLKERFEKKYRHPELDKTLTRQRLRAEVRAINKLRSKCVDLAKVMPTILKFDERDIIMTKVENAVTSCAFIKTALENKDDIGWLFEAIGTLVAQIHTNGIIHGDLTTSNILINDNRDLIPIDFGLSSSSTSCEDRAVDIYVLERALQSTHVHEYLIKQVAETYATKLGPPQSFKVTKKLNEVRMRGRKRTMMG